MWSSGCAGFARRTCCCRDDGSGAAAAAGGTRQPRSRTAGEAAAARRAAAAARPATGGVDASRHLALTATARRQARAMAQSSRPADDGELHGFGLPARQFSVVVVSHKPKFSEIVVGVVGVVLYY